MGQARKGNTVKVRYTGKLGNGEIFDISESREPIEFTIGNGEVLEGLENGIIGMETGQIKKIIVSPKEGYGPRREELIVDIKKSDLPVDISLFIGQVIKALELGGNPIRGVITHINEDTVTVDGNHPLAGKPLVFDVELIEIT